MLEDLISHGYQGGISCNLTRPPAKPDFEIFMRMSLCVTKLEEEKNKKNPINVPCDPQHHNRLSAPEI